MTTPNRSPARGERGRPTPPDFAAAMRFYAGGTRPPPDPQKETAAGAGTPAADDGDFDNRRAQHTEPAGHIQSAARLARRAP